jgi:CDP-glycerol glycerophosphotransferase
MLVTDYSSVFFDYANLKRPIIFYMYDYEFYKDELRGFYIDTEELPGEIVTTDDDLIQELQKLAGNFVYSKKFKAFNEKYNCLDDGLATQRVVERLFGSGRLPK